MAPKKILRKKRQRPEAVEEVPEEPSTVEPAKRRQKSRAADPSETASEAFFRRLTGEPSGASIGAREDEPPKAEALASEEAASKETKDMKGVVHLASLPLHMRAQKLRHILEQFGEIERIYLAPEDEFRSKNRKKSGGSKKIRFTEGWVEFAQRKLARRVAESLNGTPIGGKKRHNVFRDDIWNMRYLPKFKWFMLKEGTIYNQQVRKARLQQMMSQAQRENTFFLERVEQARTIQKIVERREAKGKPKKGGGSAPGGSRFPRTDAATARSAGAGPVVGISDRVLNSLL